MCLKIILAFMVVLFTNHYSLIAETRSADEWYLETVSHSSSSVRLQGFIQGSEIFPEDLRFQNGIESASQSLLTWAKSQHHKGDFSLALDRYEMILDAPYISKQLRGEVNLLLESAKKNQYPYTVEELIAKTRLMQSSSDRIKRYQELLIVHPNDTDIISEANRDSRYLLAWSEIQHNNRAFDVAADRYRLLLSLESLSSSLYSKASELLVLAKNDLTVSDLEITLERIENMSSSSDRLNNLYAFKNILPDERRIDLAINRSVNSLLLWTKQVHMEKVFEVANQRYQLILNSPTLSSAMRDEVEELLLQSSNEELSSSMLLETASNLNSSSERLMYYSRGVSKFPNVFAFQNGVNQSAKSLLNWTKGEHNKGNFDLAINRYKLIIDAPVTESETLNGALIKLKYADNSEVLPKLEDFLYRADQESSSSMKLAIYVDAYKLLRTSNLLIARMTDAANSLMNWAKRQHDEGNYRIAHDRYERIMNLPIVSSHLFREAKTRKEYASIDKQPPTLEYLMEKVYSEGSSSERLKVLYEAATLYSDESVSRSIEQNVKYLLNWSISQHRQQHFDVAESRYQLILESPFLEEEMRRSVIKFATLAQQESHLNTVDQYISQVRNISSSSDRLILLKEAFIVYGYDVDLAKEVDRSANFLLKWAFSQHKIGNYSVASDRYDFIIEHPYISANVKDEAKFLNEFAAKNQQVQRYHKIVNGEVAKYSYNQMVQDISKMSEMYTDLIAYHVIGQSVEGRNIYAISIGHGGKKVFFNGSHHAREHMTTNLLMQMIDDYAFHYVNNIKIGNMDVQSILNDVTLWFVPMVNPDGVMLVQEGATTTRNPSKVIALNGGSSNFDRWKSNVRGVDLNRQYPYLWSTITPSPALPGFENYKGSSPLSEPEALAVYQFTRQHHFNAAISYHSSGEVIFTRYGYANDTQRAAKGIQSITGYTPINLQFSMSGGGYTDWFLNNYRRVALTIEISPFVNQRPVPIENWGKIYRENIKVGLYMANFVR